MHNHKLITQADIFPQRAYCFTQKPSLTEKVILFHPSGWMGTPLSLPASHFPFSISFNVEKKSGISKDSFRKSPTSWMQTRFSLQFIHTTKTWQILQQIKTVPSAIKYSTYRWDDTKAGWGLSSKKVKTLEYLCLISWESCINRNSVNTFLSWKDS